MKRNMMNAMWMVVPVIMMIMMMKHSFRLAETLIRDTKDKLLAIILTAGLIAYIKISAINSILGFYRITLLVLLK
jgi:hypothetical protein